MKDVENVTGNMGEGEAVTPAEEVRNIITSDDAGSMEDVHADANIGAGEMAIARTDGLEHHRAMQLPIRGKPWCTWVRS